MSQGITPSHGVRFPDAVRVWAYVGLNTFGGPAGQIAVMHRELVERRRWVSEQRFLHALNYCMVLPGPEAQQLATYIGWLMHGVPRRADRRHPVRAPRLRRDAGAVRRLRRCTATITWVAGAAVRAGRGRRGHRRRGGDPDRATDPAHPALRSRRRGVVRGDLPVRASRSRSSSSRPALFGWVAGPARARRGSPTGGGSDGTAGRARRAAARRRAASTAAPPGRALRAAAVCLVAVAGPGRRRWRRHSAPDNVFTQEALLFSKAAVVTFGGAYAVLGYVAQQAVEPLRLDQPAAR